MIAFIFTGENRRRGGGLLGMLLSGILSRPDLKLGAVFELSKSSGAMPDPE